MIENDNRTSTNPSKDYRRKIVTVEQLREKARVLRGETTSKRPAKTIVQCHGCFDIVHPGHIRYLQFARTQGDILVISITGDASINKGTLRPYIPQELRAENLAALEFVDYVVIDPNPTACEILQSIRPDVYVKGHEYATSTDPRFIAEREIVEANGGRVIFSSGQVVFSSSRLVDTAPPSEELADERLRLVCRRHGIDEVSLKNILNEMRGRRVIVLGDVVVERYALCDANNLAGESPMVSLRVLDEKDYLGGAALIAAQIAALGGKPVLFTALGKDQTSAWIDDSLQELGVEVHAVRNRPASAIRTRFLVDDHKMFKVDRASVCPLDSVGETECADALLQEAARSDAAILHDGGLGMLTPGLLNRLGTTFRRRVPFISGAATQQGKPGVMNYVELLCSSERRLRTAMNDFDSGLSTLAYRMMERTQARQMLVTLGKRGLVTFSRRSQDPSSPGWKDRLYSEHLPSLASRVVDRLGCGDSLMTSASLALAGGANLMQAAYLGCIAAAAQIETLGPTATTVSTLRDCLRRRSELRWTDEPETGTTSSNHDEVATAHELYAV